MQNLLIMTLKDCKNRDNLFPVSIYSQRGNPSIKNNRDFNVSQFHIKLMKIPYQYTRDSN